MKRVWLLVMLVACARDSVPAQPAVSKNVIILDPSPADALVLHVRAMRWACDVTHEQEVVTDELRVPVGRAIKLVVYTPEQDVPGIEVGVVGTKVVKSVKYGERVELAFRIETPGTYAWKCPTIVPDNKTNPVKPLHAVPAADYAALIAEATAMDPVSLIARGRRLYEKRGCVACHTIDGTPRIGPSWAGIWGTQVELANGATAIIDEAYVKASILTPQAFRRPMFPPSMPSFEGQLEDHDLDALVAFIASLKDVKPAASP